MGLRLRCPYAVHSFVLGSASAALLFSLFLCPARAEQFTRRAAVSNVPLCTPTHPDPFERYVYEPYFRRSNCAVVQTSQDYYVFISP